MTKRIIISLVGGFLLGWLGFLTTPFLDSPEARAAEPGSAGAAGAQAQMPRQTAAPPHPALPAPLDPEIRQALGRMLNTSSEGLVEHTRNGVTSVDLQGRFRTVPVATIDANGEVRITDYSHLPPEKQDQ